MLDRDRSTEGTLVSIALLVCRDAGHLNPFVVAVPGGMVGKMPSTDTRKPGFDRFPGGRSLKIPYKGTQ